MKRFPKIESVRLMLSIARLQSNTDFQNFKEWLLRDCEKAQVASLKGEYQDRELHMMIGTLQVLDDLQELFENSEKWSLDMQQLERKQRARGQ